LDTVVAVVLLAAVVVVGAATAKPREIFDPTIVRIAGLGIVEQQHVYMLLSVSMLL